MKPRPAPIDPEQIKQARLTLGYSQIQLAADLGIGRTTVQAWERGRQQPVGIYRKLVIDLIEQAKEQEHRT